MTNKLPHNPFPFRQVELRIEMIDPDNHKMGAKAFISERQLTDIRVDPREVLFKALQEIAQQIVTEAFPIEKPTYHPSLQSLSEDYDTATDYKEN